MVEVGAVGLDEGTDDPTFSPASMIVFHAATGDRPVRLGTATGGGATHAAGPSYRMPRAPLFGGRAVAGCGGKGVQCHDRAVEFADVADAGGVAEAGREVQPPATTWAPGSPGAHASYQA